MWSWVPAIFWLFWALGLIGVVVFYVSRASDGPRVHGVGLARGGSAVAMLIVIILLAIWGVKAIPWTGSSTGTTPPGSSPSTSPSTSPKPGKSTASPKKHKPHGLCASTWPVKYRSHAHNRWFGSGLVAIQNAKTKAQARSAVFDWAHRVETDPVLLSGATKFILHQDVAPAKLRNGKCVSVRAKSLSAQLEAKLATASFRVVHAPKSVINSGVHHGRVTSARAVIHGNRKAVLITFRDGSSMLVLARCGNAVVLAHELEQLLG
ncbi:MAG TPA: hypothetical protein VFL85_01005 [Candidatus Saccharimonadales bacterium]|nr:hypothetical protein [Candidatus Saccharimonadales bacterium]